MSAARAPVVLTRGSERRELAAAFGAVRTQLLLVALLLALAAAAWWSTADRMAGMDAGPGTALGALGWVGGVWIVMMAAMMFPSSDLTVTISESMTRHRPMDRPISF